jgi:hypothetical protein
MLLYKAVGTVNLNLPSGKDALHMEMPLSMRDDASISKTSDSNREAVNAASNLKADPMQNVRMNDRVMSAGLGISDTGVASLYNRGWFPRRNAKFTRSNSLYPSEV